MSTSSILSKIEKVPRGIRGEKSSKDIASSRNLVSTIGALARSLFHQSFIKNSKITVSSKVSLKSIQRFWRSWKCKLSNGRWRLRTNGCRTTHDHNRLLEPSPPVPPKKSQIICSIKHSVLWLLANYAWMGPTVVGGKITLHRGRTASVNLGVITLST